MELTIKDGIKFYTREGLEIQQDVMLKLLFIIDGICSENNIDYWIDGGTLLGYARHGGYIPWDDDIDICIPIDGYYELLEKLRDYSKTADTILYQDIKGDVSWCDYFCSTEYVYEGIDGIPKPVKVDLLPVKFIEASELKIDEDKVEEIAFYVRGYKGEYNKKFRSIAHALTEKKSALELYNDYMKSKSFYSREDECLIVKGHGQFSPIKSVRFDTVYPLKRIEFEGISVSSPNDISNYLDKTYGNNYQSLLEVEKRRPVNCRSYRVEKKHEFQRLMRFNVEYDRLFFYYNSKSSILGKFWYFFNSIKHKGFVFSINRILTKIKG